MPGQPIRPEIQLLEPDFYVGRPHEHFRWLREHAPLYWDPSCELWGVSLHEDIMFLSKHPELFCSGKSSRPERDSWIPSMINLDDPQHKRRRNLVNRGFTPRRVADHEPKIREICHELVDRVCERGECEFVSEVAAPLPMIVIGDMLGVAPEDRDMLLRWSDEMLGGGATQRLPAAERPAHMRKVVDEYVAYALAVLADRRRRGPQEDLISILCHAELDGDRLSDEEIVQESLLILVGGDETTRHVITGGMRALIEHPEQRRALGRDRSRMPTAVEELLRWVTPIQNMNRTATRDTPLRGVRIREGDRLLLLYPSGNRDERVFRDPERLDLARDPNPHVAFGGFGTHFCLGAPLARLELRVMFDVLLERLPDLELASAGPLPLRPSNFIVGIEEMPVRFAPRAPRQLRRERAA